MSQKTYREGEIVWAKMRGHPAWPAKVSHLQWRRSKNMFAYIQVARPPKGALRPPGKLWIFFYGTHEQYALLITFMFCDARDLQCLQCVDDDC